MEDNHDINMGDVLEKQVSLEDMADFTLKEIVATLNGKLTKAEIYGFGYSDVIISRACEYC